jgi:Redoxin
MRPHQLLSFITTLATIFLSPVSAAFLPTFNQHPSFIASTLVSLSAAPTEEMATEIKVGDKLPSVDLMELKSPSDSPKKVNLSELIAGKKVAIFGVPGAFTPGCSKSHLPSFIDAQADLKAKSVELTVCVATNDAYVMEVRKFSDCQLCEARVALIANVTNMSLGFVSCFDATYRPGVEPQEAPMPELCSWLTAPRN